MLNSIFCADIGTSSLKTALIDFEGRLLAFSRVPFKLFHTDHAASEWLEALRQALSLCLSSIKEEPCIGDVPIDIRNISIDAICISGNGPTLCGRDGRTLLWNTELPDSMPYDLSNTKSIYIPRILGFASKFPDYWESKDCTVFSGPEYLIYLLCGKAISILPEERFMEAYWSVESFEQAGLSCAVANEAAKKLPPFVAPATKAGELTKTVASFLCDGCDSIASGLVREGIPVVCGAPDFISALVGTNTLRAGLICDRAGSSEGINLCTSKPVIASGIRTLPSIIPGLWNASVLLPESGERFSAYKEKISRLYARPVSLDEMVQILVESLSL